MKKNNVNEEDIKKLIQLPIKLENNNQLCLGKYGFYIKDKDNKNESIKNEILMKIWNKL